MQNSIMFKFLKNRYLHLFLVLLSGLILGFYFGLQSSRVIHKKNYETYEAVETFNTFAKYEIARDIAGALKKKDYENAKCLADLEASSGFDYVKQCIDNKQCASYIYNDVKERTPEILNNTHTSFDYLYKKNGIRRCDSSCLTPPSSETR
jgi:hypothetical protein